MLVVVHLFRRAGVYLAMGVAMLVIGEEFPFSNFPMYGKLPESVISIRVLNGAGEMISTQPSFGLPTFVLKKNFVRILGEQKAAGKIKRVQDADQSVLRAIGKEVLDWMLEHHSPRQASFGQAKVQLEVRRYRVVKGRIVITPEIVAVGTAKPYLAVTP
jgi:hypothetical protein